jgi:cytochrome c556
MRGLLALAFAATAGCTSVVEAPPEEAARAEPTAEQIIIARRAGMAMTVPLLGGIGAAVRGGGDVKGQAGAAGALARWGEAIPGLFPPGSGAGDTRAKPEIWADKADFDRRAAEFAAAARRLAELARAGDAAGFAAQAEIVKQGCAACHGPYRTEPAR